MKTTNKERHAKTPPQTNHNEYENRTLNLCLGLRNRKEEVKRIIQQNKTDILCLQETKLESDIPTDILSFRGYNFEAETNSKKIRCGTYIKDNQN